MNIGMKSNISYKDLQSKDEFKDLAVQMYRMETSEAMQYLGGEIKETISSIHNQVIAYRQQFETTFKKFTTEDTMLYKIKTASLDPSNKDRSDKSIIITQQELNKRMSTMREVINTMEQGYNLLHSIRYQLTGQTIETEMSVVIPGRGTYRIPASVLKDKGFLTNTLSTFGGGTISNPFSLAYNLDIKAMQNDMLFLEQYCKESDNIEQLDIYQLMKNSLKPAYLAQKSLETGRKYPNIYFDGKDMEIINLSIQTLRRGGSFDLDLEKYTHYRKTMGGGGGYRTSFYKMGDVGAIQDKFFKLKSKERTSATVSYTRFSLLRDKFAKLDRILSSKYYSDVVKGLVNFFTENEKNVSDEISREFNEAAKNMIVNNLLNGLI